MACSDSSSGIISFFGGAVVALLAHVFSIYREAQNRKHADKAARETRRAVFLAFMNSWELQTVRFDSGYIAHHFEEKVILFAGEIAKIATDYAQSTLGTLARQLE